MAPEKAISWQFIGPDSVNINANATIVCSDKNYLGAFELGLHYVNSKIYCKTWIWIYFKVKNEKHTYTCRVSPPSSRFQCPLDNFLGFLHSAQDVLVLEPVRMIDHQMDQNLHFMIQEMRPLKHITFRKLLRFPSKEVKSKMQFFMKIEIMPKLR